MKTENKWNNKETEFNCKADAFQWLNNTPVDTDLIKLYYNNELRYSKGLFGIYNDIDQCYINGKLPVEWYI